MWWPKTYMVVCTIPAVLSEQRDYILCGPRNAATEIVEREEQLETACHCVGRLEGERLFSDELGRK